MKDVFDCAYVTLCAVQGDCSNSGFLQRDCEPSIEIPFKSALRPAVSGSFFLRVIRPQVLGYPREKAYDHASQLYLEDVKSSSWNKRGWTFQESWSQSVQILFGSNMTYCISNDAMEAENGSLEDGRAMDLEHIFPQPHATRPSSVFINQEEGLHRWSWVLGGYTGRHFTYEKDRLPAISGIARSFFGDAKEGEYLAGLWRMDLHRGLLWGCSIQFVPCTAHSLPTLKHCLETRWPPQRYVAPSWSWASHSYNIGWPWIWTRAGSAPISSPICQFLEAETTLEGRNPFGSVTSGHLKIRGKMCSIGDPGGVDSLPLANDISYRVGTPDWAFTAYLTLDFDTPGEGLYGRIPLWPEGRSRGFEMLVTTDLEDGDVAGLVLLPVDDENVEDWEYWRVGVWFSETEGGAFVAGMEEKTIRVI